MHALNDAFVYSIEKLQVAAKQLSGRTNIEQVRRAQPEASLEKRVAQNKRIRRHNDQRPLLIGLAGHYDVM